MSYSDKAIGIGVIGLAFGIPSLLTSLEITLGGYPTMIVQLSMILYGLLRLIR